MSSIDPITSEPRRFSMRLPRPLWIGLAAFVLVVIAVALRIGLPIYRQHAAVREIERVGGYVLTHPPNLEWLPERLQNRIRDDERMDVFGTVEEIGSVGPDFTDAGMERIAPLTDLHCLRLGRWIMDVRVYTGPIPLFEPLESKHRRSDAAQFSDAGLACLTRMKNLQVLDLNGTGVTDPGLAHVGKLTELRSLDLHATRVTDAGLRHLRPLTKLEWLDLRMTKVSDSGLNELHGLSRLKALAIDGTEVTHDGANELRRALPDISIEW